jgi:DNA-directed RNA polymerase subunit RPC12/RpoP
MGIFRTYGCAECGAEFEIYHHDRDEAPPSGCPNCSVKPAAPYLALPRGGKSIGSNISKAVDQTYAGLEAQGQRAFEMSGNPHAKVTNLKDNLREGDVAAMVPQPSKEYREAVAHLGGAAGFGAGASAGGGDSFQPAAMLPGLRGTGSAASILTATTTERAARHRNLTGAFRRPPN